MDKLFNFYLVLIKTLNLRQLNLIKNALSIVPTSTVRNLHESSTKLQFEQLA